MEKKRGSELIVIIGHNNTGKTSFAKKLIEGFNKRRDLATSKKKYPSNYYKLAVYDVQDQFGDYMREGDMSIRTSDKDWCKKLLKMRKGMVVLDDYKVLIPNDTMSEDLLNLLQFRAEYGLDIVLIVHNPQLILQRLSYYIDTYCLFYTAGNKDSFKGRLSGSDRLIELKKMIDNEYKSYSPLAYSKLYPNFPFIYYNGKNEKVKLVNFKK